MSGPSLSKFDLLLIGFLMGKFSAKECFELIEKKDLWPDNDDMFLALCIGRETLRAKESLSRGYPAVGKAVSTLLRPAESDGLIEFDAARFIERLFENESVPNSQSVRLLSAREFKSSLN
jgi:hypothetical protein